MKLTDETLELIKPGLKPQKYFDGGGLFLLVQPSGGKWWRFKYRMGSKEKQLSLGTYPSVSLTEARSKHQAFRTMVADGIDPSEQAKLNRARQVEETDRQRAASRFLVDIRVTVQTHRDDEIFLGDVFQKQVKELIQLRYGELGRYEELIDEKYVDDGAIFDTMAFTVIGQHASQPYM